ncbi:MAG: hypothetical protein JO202_08080 [Ktedonobacteraceae bacterium]|nr:hypothetical protein [Ktedonobacteraceae bacterium]
MQQQSSSSANHFTFSGQNIKITYDLTSLLGKPQLTYQNAEGSTTFVGDEIRTQSTEIGTLVSVTLGGITFPVRKSLSFLVPNVLLGGLTQTEAFRTVAILATVLTEPPTPSVQQEYNIVPLEGVASIVVS